MIHYALRCSSDHAFDGWFRGSAAFEAQASAGQLACPLCGSQQVSRAIMAPRPATGAAAPAAPAPSAPTPAPATPRNQAPAMPDQLRAQLQRMRAEVERSCDYVGPNFADTARAMHAGTEAPRAIYGESTPEQSAALAEDGIEVARIPWVPRADG